MKTRLFIVVLLSVVSFVFAASSVLCAPQAPDKPIVIKLEGAKMPPVTFSHSTHVDKNKIACVKCHHKDAQNPRACTTCHGMQAKGEALAAKDAFHTTCQGCHKESSAKGVKAPITCIECHTK